MDLGIWGLGCGKSETEIVIRHMQHFMMMEMNRLTFVKVSSKINFYGVMILAPDWNRFSLLCLLKS